MTQDVRFRAMIEQAETAAASRAKHALLMSLADSIEPIVEKYAAAMGKVDGAHNAGTLSPTDRYQKTADAGAQLRYEVDLLRRKLLVKLKEQP